MTQKYLHESRMPEQNQQNITTISSICVAVPFVDVCVGGIQLFTCSVRGWDSSVLNLL